MKAHSTLFSSATIRALLSGLKTQTRRLGAAAAIAAIGSQLVSGCATIAGDSQPTWRPTPQQGAAFRPLNPGAPAADFVPVEEVNKAFPRRLSDDVDMTIVIEMIALILAVGNAPTSPKKASPQEPPRP